MKRDSVALIEEWFAGLRDVDGDFVCYERDWPFSVIGPAGSNGRVIFTTKPRPLSAAMEECAAIKQFGLIGRYGLPRKGDLGWIRKVVGSREILFLGDMDPPDLMIFAWLRARLHPKRVTHLGISDAYLAAADCIVSDSFTIPLSTSEQRSLVVLKKVLPDLRKILGPECHGLLAKHRKVELEAVVSAKGGVAALLTPALR